MTSGIYRIVNMLDGKVYVGSAKNLSARERSHWDGLRKGKHHSILLQRAYDKHGKASFAFEVIETCPAQSRAILQQREQYWLDALRSYERDTGYNICKNAYSSLGMRHSDETKKKLAKPFTEQRRANVSDGVKRSFAGGRQVWNKGRQHSEETRQKISSVQRAAYLGGRQHPRPNLGIKLPDQWKQKILQSRAAYFAKGGKVWNAGKKGLYLHSDETRKKLADAVKKSWIKRREGLNHGV